MSEILHTKWGNARVSGGYYRITSKKEGYGGKMLHRLIYEDFWGVKLPPQIQIHHKNKDPLCNCILNLEAMTMSKHRSLHQTGKIYSEGTRRKISESNKGKILSNETRKKLSEIHKGMKYSEETYKKMSKAKNTSGFFRVCKEKNIGCKQGFTWCYQYYDDGNHKSIRCVDLNKLKQKVLDKGLEWCIVDENKAKDNMR